MASIDDLIFGGVLVQLPPDSVQVVIGGAGGGGAGTDIPIGTSTFIALTDTPDSYAGSGGKSVSVKVDESGLEFIKFQTQITGNVTALVNGQDFIDVLFDVDQGGAEWVLLSSGVVNTVDPDPLNIWTGIMTLKNSSGFRLQLNGAPDSDKYFLSWSFNGVGGGSGGIVEATSYILSGPTTGNVNNSSANFSISLPLATTILSPVIFTPDDGGAGGTLTPTTVTLTSATTPGVFTYTPIIMGNIIISTVNNGGLTNPSPLTYTAVSTVHRITSDGSIRITSDGSTRIVS